MRLALGLAILLAGCSTGGNAARDEASQDRPTTREIHKVDLKDLAVWRYDAVEDQWTVVRGEVMRAVLFEPIGRVESPTTRPLRADPIGLYWVGWIQDGVRRGTFIFRGHDQCDDAALAALGTPPPGKVAACVPTDGATAPQFVPDPRLHCK